MGVHARAAALCVAMCDQLPAAGAVLWIVHFVFTAASLKHIIRVPFTSYFSNTNLFSIFCATVFLQHSGKCEGAVPAAAWSTMIADFQDLWPYAGPGAMQDDFIAWIFGKTKPQTNRILKNENQIFCCISVKNHSLQRSDSGKCWGFWPFCLQVCI